MYPTWLHDLSIAALIGGAICAVVVAIDEVRHPQRMWIMNVVWPTVALFGTVATVWAYFRYGRLSAEDAMRDARRGDQEPPSKRETPFAMMVAKGASHCGSGCMLGDVAAEWLAFVAPVVAVWFGWHHLFGDKIYAVWLLDFVFAFLLGVAFQYFTITPMRDLSPGAGLVAALKADTLSLVAWQVGMYGFMAFAQFYAFGHLLGHRAETDTPEFWFMMQIAMIFGFSTSYPVNWWLLKIGVKERM